MESRTCPTPNPGLPAGAAIAVLAAIALGHRLGLLYVDGPLRFVLRLLFLG